MPANGNTGDAPAPTTLTHPQTVARMGEIMSELERLGELDDLTAEQEAEFADLRDTYQALDLHRRQLERAADLAEIRSLANGANGSVRLGGVSQSRHDYDRDAILEPDSVEDRRFRDPWNLSEVRMFGRSDEDLGLELRSRALSAIEQMQGANDAIREAATDILENRCDGPNRLAQQILLTSSPAYMRAWSKLARNAPHTMTAEEQRAMNEAENFRAMSLTTTAGGFLVPFQLDPTVIITSNGSRNDIRRVARQVVATGNKWNGVSSAAVSWSWDSEASEVSDDATTFAQPAIDIYSARGFVPISIEALMDEQNVTSEVARLLAQGKDDLEAVALATGTGSQPQGIVTALTGTSSEINAAADDTFAIGDVYTIEGALPARYRANAAWLANNSIYNLIRRFDTAGGGGFWANLTSDRPPQLLGRPALECEGMDGTVTTTGAVSNYILVYGDFDNYVIADRIGMTVEFLPHLFAVGGGGRPTGQRGWFAHARMGADSVNDGAFRMLDVPSAA